MARIGWRDDSAVAVVFSLRAAELARIILHIRSRRHAEYDQSEENQLIRVGNFHPKLLALPNDLGLVPQKIGNGQDCLQPCCFDVRKLMTLIVRIVNRAR
jgi:hypothetical protein